MNDEYQQNSGDVGSRNNHKAVVPQSGCEASRRNLRPGEGRSGERFRFPSFSRKQATPRAAVAGEERGTWPGRLDFLLSCLGYAVGLGNVWRFPYLCYQNGGGAFLVPYACMLLLVGLPVFGLELALGQYGAMAPITLFTNLCPAFKGIGYAMFLAAAMVAIYYNMIIAWSIYYLFASFTSDLPWQHCGHNYNSPNCFSDVAYEQCKEMNGSVYNLGRCFTNRTEIELLNISDITPELRVSAPEEYLNVNVLALSAGVGDVGRVQWGLALSLLLAWVVVFLCLVKGIKSSGKVVYFTATFPYLVLFILLIRGVTLPGAYDGIRFYMVPDWARLGDVKVWKDAAVQIFYSLSIASGGLVTLASYNQFHNNIVRDTLIVCFSNCLTSVFAGFAIFSILGFMAHELGVPVDKVVTEGPGLAFVAYPDVVSRLPASPLWAVLFFFMLFLLGLDSQFAIVENITASLMDEFPVLRARNTCVILAVSVIGYLLGLPLATQGGRYILDLMDNYAAGWPYLFIGLCETVVVGYVYGVQNFLSDIRHMTKLQPQLWGTSHLVVVYMTITPLILTLILLLSFVSYQPLKVGGYVFPTWANVIGWIMAIVPIMLIPGFALYQLFWVHQTKAWKQRLALVASSTADWRKNALLVSKVECDDPKTPTQGFGAGGAYDNLAYSEDQLRGLSASKHTSVTPVSTLWRPGSATAGSPTSERVIDPDTDPWLDHGVAATAGNSPTDSAANRFGFPSPEAVCNDAPTPESGREE